MLVGEAECSCGGFTSGALAAVDAGIGTFSFALASEGVVEREELWLPPLLVLAMRGAETGLELEFASTWAWKRLMSSDARAGRDLSIVGTVARVAPSRQCARVWHPFEGNKARLTRQTRSARRVRLPGEREGRCVQGCFAGRQTSRPWTAVYDPDEPQVLETTV